MLLRSGGADKLARLKVPKVLPRLVRIPDPADPDVTRFVWLEDLITAHLHELFPGHQAIEAYPFHLTRDSDIEIDDDEDAHDLLATMRELLSERTFGSVVRLMVDTRMPVAVVNWLLAQLGATERELYVTEGPLALEDMMELLRLDRPDLKDPPFTPSTLGGNPDERRLGRARYLRSHTRAGCAHSPPVPELRHLHGLPQSGIDRSGCGCDQTDPLSDRQRLTPHSRH